MPSRRLTGLGSRRRGSTGPSIWRRIGLVSGTGSDGDWRAMADHCFGVVDLAGRQSLNMSTAPPTSSLRTTGKSFVSP